MDNADIITLAILSVNVAADHLLTSNEPKIKLATVSSWQNLSPDLDDCLSKQSEDLTVYS